LIYIELWVWFWFKKLAISFRIIEEVKIISLCSQIEVLLKENYFEKSFLINASFISQSNSFSLRSLIDSDFVVYMLIHNKLVDKVCQKLEIQFISLAKEKLIRDYDEKLARKTITHKILLNLTIESHKKLTVSMLIADIEHHEVILSKLWMNKNEILLNMKHDTIVFPDQLDISISVFSISSNTKHLSWSRSTLISSAAHSKIFKMLKHSVSFIQKESFLIQNIDVVFFQALVKWKKKNQTEIFAMFIEDIDREIIYNTQCKLDVINVFSVNETTQNLEDIKVKLSSKYQNFLDVFDQAQADKLSSHHSYDHKIKLTSDATSSCCRAYWMSFYKLQKVKKYLNENLFKEFIISSKASYSSLVLFTLKANKDLRFCIEYRKLNAIIKRNCYSLSLINEMINKIVDCRHLTRLNIISTFNKLQMHSDSKNYTIFIIALEVYKSKMLSFELINDSASFQQYMNDILWDFLNDFCQVYLDDILIYSKTQWKHQQHVKMILNHLREADLQVDIRKCKFNVEETVFLEVIVSEQDLHMNSIKVKVIVNWATSINLKEVQSFMRFVNFYHHFIKNFSKLVKSFTQLTRKDTSFVWNKVCVQAFDDLKKQVSLILVLRHFNSKRQTILKINASDYVKDEILSQYDDKRVFHSVAFYSKSMIFAECNYHIYDKKLLVIIRCFEHWRLKLECTELLIQMFIDHQTLKIFMKNKQLTQRQVNYLNILFKFNFQIIFRSDKINSKVNALIRMFLINISESAQRTEDYYQIILTLDKINILAIESEVDLYQRVKDVNKTNELCNEYKQAISKNKLKLHSTELKHCEIVDDVLFRKDLLWVSEKMHTKLLKKIHDQSFISHSDNQRTIDLVQRFYYWSDYRATIRRYIWNCHAYQRSKAFKNSINKLLHSLSISQKRWKDIAMNFITELSLSEDYNIICTIICWLIKKRHYVFCHWEDEDISVKETIWIMLWNVYQLHDLLSFIVSNRDSQFISIMWQSLCKWLRITTSLSTVYYSEINDQLKWANQDVERELRIYCNYMQNNWAKWLLMIEFSKNFNIFSIISMTSFYFNKSFHSRMSFDSDTTNYKTTRERLEARKADDIIIQIKELLIFNRQQLKKMKQIIKAQINKHRRNVIYEVDDWVWLFFRNIKITRSCKNLKDKQLKLYQITVKVEIFYHLRLSISMKQLHSMFSSKLLRSYFNDLLSEQHSESLRSLTIEDDDHWKIDDILNSRCYQGRVQYKVKWTELNQDNEWYYVDKEEFESSKEVLVEFHKLYSVKSH